MEERIGQGLIRIGAMSEEQVKDILARQKDGTNKLFGEIAIELGYVDDEAIKRYLDSK